MNHLTITPITMDTLGRIWRKWRVKRALRASQRNSEVLREYIAFYQQELTAEHRKQLQLSNAIKELT